MTETEHLCAALCNVCIFISYSNLCVMKISCVGEVGCALHT